MQIRKLQLLISLLLLILLFPSSPAWAKNWCDDANVSGCWVVEDDGTGTTVEDLSTNERDFSFNGTPTWETASPPASYSTYYLDFNGSAEYLVRAGWFINSDTTIVQWLKPDSTDVFSWAGYNQYGANFGGEGYSIYQRSTDGGQWAYRVIIDGNSDFIYSNSAPTGDWQHIAATHKGSVMTIYVDGVAQTDIGSVAAGNVNTNQDDSLRSGSINQYSGDYYNGQTDETAFFKTALDSTDINDIMENGLVQEEDTWIPKVIMF